MKLGQGNIFRTVCQEFCQQGEGGLRLIPKGEVKGSGWGGLQAHTQGKVERSGWGVYPGPPPGRRLRSLARMVGEGARSICIYIGSGDPVRVLCLLHAMNMLDTL